MASMSYCRFENTSVDLFRCVEDLKIARDQDKTLEQFIECRTSEHEQRAVRAMYELCSDFVRTYEELEELGKS